MEKEKKFVKNRFGVSIVKCCASCKFKAADRGTERVCSIGGEKVTSDYLCPVWEMADHLDNAGIGDGMVKKLHYLRYVVNYPRMAALKDIRKEYSEKYGSIYLSNR